MSFDDNFLTSSSLSLELSLKIENDHVDATKMIKIEKNTKNFIVSRLNDGKRRKTINIQLNKTLNLGAGTKLL